MKFENILNIVLTVLGIFLSFLSYYLYLRAKIYKEVTSAVNSAEQDGKVAEEKLKLATDQIYSVIPSKIRGLFPRKLIETIVNAAFRHIEKYAKKQVIKAFKSLNQEKDK